MIPLEILLEPLASYLSSPCPGEVLCPRRVELLGTQEELRSDRLYLGDAQGARQLTQLPMEAGTVILLSDSATAQVPQGVTLVSLSCSLPLLFNTVSQALTQPEPARPDRDFLLLWEQIMNRQLTGADEIREALSRMPHPVEKFVQVAILSCDGAACGTLHAELERLYPDTNMAIYHRSLILLFSYPERSFLRQIPQAEALSALLERHDAYLAVSNRTRNLSSLPFLYRLTRQAAVLARQLDLEETGSRIHFYEKYSIYSAIDLCAQRFTQLYGSDDIIYLIHPAIIHLTRYDREHNTNLRDVLYYYLINDRNLVKTASTLYMHRNTVINKVSRIGELVDLDLEDGSLRHRLIFSCQVIRYYEKVMHLNLKL